jgi:hypothetical protein
MIATIKEVKKIPTELEKIVANHRCGEGLLSSSHKELFSSNYKEPKQPN